MDASRYIRRHLPLAKIAELPGVRLHLAGPASQVSRLTKKAPYWAYVWAGGLAVARYLLHQPQVVAGRRVLDLGAGSGVVGIVAARLGAIVQAVEPDPLGRVAIGLNAAANGVSIAVLDRLGPIAADCDLILAGDVFYDAALAAHMLAQLRAAAAQGVPCLIGDPGRRTLPVADLVAVAQYPVPDFGQSGLVTGTVYRLREGSQRPTP